MHEIHESDKSKIQKFILNKAKLTFIGFGVRTHLRGALYKNKINPNREKGVFTLLTVSRMRLFEKRIEVMIETLEILLKQYKKNVELVLAGDGKDMLEIQNLVNDRRLQENVTFLGFVDNPEKVMMSADLYLCAMVGDETGVSGVQAGQSKIPVVGIQTVHGYESDTVKAYSDPSDLAEAIATFIDDPISLSEYASLGQQYFEQRFSAETMINKYKQLYSSL